MQYQSSLFGLLRKGAALLLCLCLLAGCTNQQQEQPQLASSTGTEPEQTEESTSSHEVDAEYYLGETTFIGDSRTNGLLTYQLLPPEQVFAIDGSTQKTIREDAFIQLEPGGEYLTVEQAVAERQPSRILIAFGVNAIPLMTDEEFMEEYDILVDQLVAVSPDSKIVIQSILPVANWKYLEMPSLTNENIDYHNALLEDYAEENGYTFFDISDYFKDETIGRSRADRLPSAALVCEKPFRRGLVPGFCKSQSAKQGAGSACRRHDAAPNSRTGLL